MKRKHNREEISAFNLNPEVDMGLEIELDTKVYGGSFWNPIEWNAEIGEIAAGISPDINADGWFVCGEEVHRCIKDGAPTLFNDEEFWVWKED